MVTVLFDIYLDISLYLMLLRRVALQQSWFTRGPPLINITNNIPGVSKKYPLLTGNRNEPMI